jgi:stearoyl-CoA desaturase (delta-9 desaturase)
MMVHGLLGFSFWEMVFATLLMTQITVISVTIYLHRCQAHRALDLHPAISHFFRFWLWLTTGMTTKAWTAIHRKHHAKCETEEDPHSPVIMGIKTVLFNGAELYRKEKLNQETMERYGQGTPDDRAEKFYTEHSMLGVKIMLVLNIILFGLPGITIWAVQMMWIPFFAAGVINGIGHYFGYRNFECPDAARNIIPFGILLSGEELHNNHHTFGSSAKLSSKWWEFDLGWFFIKTFSILGLISNPSKQSIDGETLKAVLLNRFNILSNYSKQVVLPMIKKEKIKIDSGLKALLIREQHMIDKMEHKKLVFLLQKQKMLNLVYQYRLSLQDIWSRTSASQKELLDALHQWCKSAEDSGIEVLKHFAIRMKSYVTNLSH